MAGGKISMQVRNLIVRDVKRNQLQREIAKKYGVSRGAVQKIILKYQKLGSVADRPGRGSKRKSCERTDNLIIREIKKDPRITVRAIRERLDLTISDRTIRRRIAERDLKSCFAKKRPMISTTNKTKRLLFARNHINKPLEFWKHVIWSDESKFELFNKKRRLRVWRKSDEGLQDRHLQPTMKHGGGNIMVWGCFSWFGVGNLTQVNGIMTADGYIDILCENLEESMLKMGLEGNYTFQQDNDPKHTAKKTRAFFRSTRIKCMEWPPQSPDLNPIENLWAILDNKVDKSGVTNKQAYFAALQKAWNDLDPQHLRNLVESIPKRLQLVIEAKGGHIGY
jgi:transposase